MINLRRAARPWMRVRPADATRVAPQRRSIHVEVDVRQGETGAAVDGNEGVGGLRTSVDVGERGGTRTRPSKGGPCWVEQQAGTMTDASMSETMSPGLLKVVERAKMEPEGRFHSLAHLIDVSALKRAYRRMRKDAAVGEDKVTKEQYGQALEHNLHDLHERLVSMRYRHQPIRRVHIPKEKGKTRPIGISAFEDKLVQDAVREVLEAIYEQDFLDCSHGFRPKRSAHDAIRLLPFRRPPAAQTGGKAPATFDFLGFTLHWQRARSGRWGMMCKTRQARLRRSIQAISDWCRRDRHQPVKTQHAALTRRIRGHCNYFGVSGNSRSLQLFVEEAKKAWYKWLRRRSQQAHLTWEGFRMLLTRLPLPKPRIAVRIRGIATRQLNGGAGGWKSPCPVPVRARGSNPPGLLYNRENPRMPG